MSNLNRREFLKVSLGTGAGLAIGFSLNGCKEDIDTDLETSFQPNAWLKISPDNTVTIIVAESEMGQGVMTSLPMLIAEELETDWTNIKTEQAPVSPSFGYQTTGGSSSVRNAWLPLREAGAIAREMLISAAALIWSIPVNQCRAENGFVISDVNGEKVSYGELSSKASELPVPDSIKLKDQKDFKIIGKSKLLLDAPDKVQGKTIYGCDVSLPDLLIATITHCPYFEGKLVSYDDTKARMINGVNHIIQIGNSIAIVGENFWAVKKAQNVLDIQWDNTKNTLLSSHSIEQIQNESFKSKSELIYERGNIDNGLKKAVNIIESTYQAPFEAHMTMEPMNCTAYVRNGQCDVWAPTQSPSGAKSVAERNTLTKSDQLLRKIKNKLDKERFDEINVHTTFLGGGFGRRLVQDYVAEAVQISKIIEKPVKLIWTREEDIQHDYYRPATSHKLKAGLDDSGAPVFWNHRIVGDSKGKSTGGAKNSPYDIANFQLEYIEKKHPVKTGSWRSVGNSHNGFILESFIDEIAASTKKDPYDFRSDLLSNSPRHKIVLDKAAKVAKWGEPLTDGHYHGIAVHESYGSFVAQIAEISINRNKEIRVHKVICVIDCGITINPDTVKAQMEGGIVFGLTACLKKSISINNGRVEQSNFHDSPILTMNEMPVIETHIISSAKSPGGVGEPAVPPIAAAIANAVYAATGIRVRKMPILPTDLVAS